MKGIVLWALFLSLFSIHSHAGMNPSMSQLMQTHYEEPQTLKNNTLVQPPSPSHYALILLFSSQCAHCVHFAPIVKHFVEEKNWSIEAISLNGQSLPEFPDVTLANQDMIDVLYQGKPVVYPALFMANTQTKALYPISFGALSYPELEARVQLLQNTIRDYEGRH